MPERLPTRCQRDDTGRVMSMSVSRQSPVRKPQHPEERRQPGGLRSCLHRVETPTERLCVEGNEKGERKMRTTMLRVGALLLAGAVTLTAACGGSKDEDKSSTSNSETKSSAQVQTKG